MGGLIYFVALLLLGLLAGHASEKSHLKKIVRRETEFSNVLVTTLRTYPEGVASDCVPELVRGEVVIASDYLKTFLAKLKNFLGGNLGTYEKMMDRAIREALTRIQEEAMQRGFDAVCNVRIDTANINGAGTTAKAMPMAVVFVNGTAYRRAKGR